MMSPQIQKLTRLARTLRGFTPTAARSRKKFALHMPDATAPITGNSPMPVSDSVKFPVSQLRRAGLRLTTVLGVASAVLISNAFAGDAAESQGPSSDSAIEYSDVVNGGLLFVDGKHIPGPHSVQATSETITVNGVPVEVTLDGRDFDDMMEDEDWDMDRVERRGRSRSRRGSRETRQTPARSARRLVQCLSDDFDVVIFTGQPLRVIPMGDDKYALYTGLLTNEPTSEQRQEFLRVAKDQSAVVLWDQWLTEFRISSTLRKRLEQFVTESDAVVAEMESKMAAQYRLETFAYPLTLVGMMLGVIAFGHMLKWTGRNFVCEQNGGSPVETIRCVETGLLLMLGMSGVDLLWTIMAGQAGVMTEVNPLAASFIHSPSSLALFKVTATAIGCGVLYAFRERRRVQEVTWWMCLVCVLVTFRWVMFDSMTTS